MPTYVKWLIGIGATVLILFFSGCTAKNLALTYVDSYEMGYRFDAGNGTIEVLPRTGWHRKTPFVQEINTVDLRPMQVCINANSRVLNCKLVKFNSAGLRLFLDWHGRQNYDQTALNPILMSYAYDGSGKTYPFLTVLRELKNEEVDLTTPISAPVPIAQPAPGPADRQ